ncbi:MAG: hypothetical protein ACRCX2_33380 [Paraclostridium sp.]
MDLEEAMVEIINLKEEKQNLVNELENYKTNEENYRTEKDKLSEQIKSLKEKNMYYFEKLTMSKHDKEDKEVIKKTDDENKTITLDSIINKLL